MHADTLTPERTIPAADYGLQLIPRQIVAIVQEDATVLSSYDSFWAALAGPD